MDPAETQGNPAAANGVSETNDTGTNSLTDIMGSMTSSTEPEAKPDNGNKAEGTEKSQNKQELPAWTSQLPEELRSNADVMKQLGKFMKIGDLAKSYSELESTYAAGKLHPMDLKNGCGDALTEILADAYAYVQEYKGRK
mgnify:CR=1 FL=1